MHGNVTVLGANGHTIKLKFSSEENRDLARQLAGRISEGVRNGTIAPASDRDGPPPTLPGGVHGEYVQTRSGLVALPSGYTALVETAKTALVFGSHDEDQIVLAGKNTQLTFIATNGSGTVVAGGNHNRLETNGGDWLLSSGPGDDRISAMSNGNNTIQAGAGHNAIRLGSGRNVVEARGDDTVRMTGGAVTIDATNARSTLVFGGDSDMLFVGGSGGATIEGGTGSDTYFGSLDKTRDQVVHGGKGGNNLLFAGNGAATLFGGGAGDQLFAYGHKEQMLVASNANTTLDGGFGWGNNTFVSGKGDDLVVGGTGKDLFIGGQGHDTVFATEGGRDTFEFINHHAGGHTLIENIYDASDVRIHLVDYGKHEISDALHSQTSDGASVSVCLSDGTHITFENITHLNRDNFN